jgi:hypothetical protein
MGLCNTNHAMRGKLRQWFVDNPSGMDAAYALLVGSWILIELGIQDAGGSTVGP